MRFILFFLILPIQTFAQTGIPSDDMPMPLKYEWVMELENPSDEEVSYIKILWNQYLKRNMDTCLLLAQKGAEMMRNHENQVEYGRMLFLLAKSHYVFGAYEEGEKALKECIEVGERENNRRLIAIAYDELGRLETKRSEYDKSLEYYQLALAEQEKLKDTTQLHNIYYNIAGLYFNMELWQKTEFYTDKAAEMAQVLDERYQERIINARGIIYTQIGQNYRRKVDSAQSNPQVFKDSMTYFLERAIENGYQYLEFLKESNDQRKVLVKLNDLVDTYISLENYEEALELSKEAIAVSEGVGDLNQSSRANYNIANLYHNLGQTKKALPYVLSSLEVGEKQGYEMRVGKSHYLLYRIYQELGQYKKALSHLGSYQDYLKKTNDQDKNKIVAEAEAKYQNVEKEKQILAQENDILILEKENASISNQRNMLLGGGIAALFLTIIAFRFQKLRRERNEKKAFTEALMFAQEYERKRIARDLHDGVGQSLLLIKKQMETNREATLENQQLVAETLEEVRAISRDLHPFQLDKVGLSAAIREVLHKIEQSTDIFISHEMDPIDKVLSDKAEINLYRTIQEGFNNIVKHSEATAAKLSIQRREGEITVKIYDNGKGFDHELAIVKEKSLGLRTMHERILSLGGKFKIGKGESKGTVLDILIPIE